MSTASQLGLIRQAMTAIRSDFPKAVASAIADCDKVAQASANFRAPSPDELAETVAACILRGEDPAANEQVRHMTTARALASEAGGYSMNVAAAADRRVVAALTNDADTIVESLCVAASAAGDTLAKAYALIGDHDLTDSELILRLGPDVARAWAEAREAIHLLRVVERAWGALASLTQFASTSEPPTLRLADINLETFEKLGRNAGPWEIVRAGGTISLANRDTIRERSQQLTASRDSRQAGHDTAAQHAQGARFRFTA